MKEISAIFFIKNSEDSIFVAYQNDNIPSNAPPSEAHKGKIMAIIHLDDMD